jgi:hypothetical protein
MMFVGETAQHLPAEETSCKATVTALQGDWMFALGVIR